MVNTGELQTHLLATSKGKNYHKMKQQSGKPLENPFIGYVFSEESGTIQSLHYVRYIITPAPCVPQPPPPPPPPPSLFERMISAILLEVILDNYTSLCPISSLDSGGFKTCRSTFAVVPFLDPGLHMRSRLLLSPPVLACSTM